MAKLYTVRAKLHNGYTLFVANLFGGYHVMVKSGDHVYSVYGGYRHIGTACNRLLRSAATWHNSPVEYKQMTRADLDARGAFEGV